MHRFFLFSLLSVHLTFFLTSQEVRKIGAFAQGWSPSWCVAEPLSSQPFQIPEPTVPCYSPQKDVKLDVFVNSFSSVIVERISL